MKQKKTLKIINVSVNATQQLWKAKALGTKYFQYNVSRTNESNSYSNAMSNRTKWKNLSSVSGFAVALLNYSAKTEQFNFYSGVNELDEEVRWKKK